MNVVLPHGRGKVIMMDAQKTELLSPEPLKLEQEDYNDDN